MIFPGLRSRVLAILPTVVDEYPSSINKCAARRIICYLVLDRFLLMWGILTSALVVFVLFVRVLFVYVQIICPFLGFVNRFLENFLNFFRALDNTKKADSNTKI